MAIAIAGGAVALPLAALPLAAREPTLDPPGPDEGPDEELASTKFVVPAAPATFNVARNPAPIPRRAILPSPARNAERARRRSNRHPNGKTKFTLGRLFTMAGAPGGLRPRCALLVRAANLAVDKHNALKWDFDEKTGAMVYTPVDGVTLTPDQAAIVLG